MSRVFGVSRRDRIAGLGAAAALVLGLAPLVLGTSSAGAATSVTHGGVTLDSGTAGATTGYTIGLRTSGSGSLGAGSSITFSAPSGTSFPSCSLLNCSAYSVTAGSGSATVSSANVSGSTVQINLALSSISASDTVTVRITGVGNPTVASSAYSIEESTSSDTAAVATSTYSIAPAAVASVTSVSGGGQTTKVGTAFQQPLVVVLEDRFGNKEPAGIQVSFASPACGSSPCASATFSNGNPDEVVNTAADGTASSGTITADATPGSYSVTASDGALNASFGLRNVFPVTPGPVGVAFPQAGSTTVYTVPFTTSAAGGCSPTCTVDLVAPGGTVFPSTPASYAVAVGNQHSATISSVSAPAGAHSVAIGLSSSNIGAGDPVTVTISGVGNPTAASGGYSIQESTSTDSAPAPSQPYAITAAAPAVLQPVIGNGQNAQVQNPFPSQLVALVSDAYGNPVPGAQVTFTAPASMNGAAFGACDDGNPTATECLSISDGSGYATAPSLIAGASSGAFNVVATSGHAQSASFAVTVLQSGYWMAASDGGIFSFGGAPYSGSEGGQHLNAPIVGMAAGAHGGYYMVASDGGIFTFGGAPFYGSRGGQHLNAPVVGMAVDPSTGGYWLVASDGGIFSYNAPFFGSMGGQHLNKPIVGMAATPDGSGYYLVASDGGIFSFNAPFYQSLGGHPLNAPVVGMAVVPAGGYYLVASDGGLFTFGPGTVFLGSASGLAPYGSVIGMAIDPATDGYWMADKAGHIYTFGTQFYGSMQGKTLNKPVVAIAASAGL